MIRTLGLVLLVGVIFPTVQHGALADSAQEWIAEVCDGVAFGSYGTEDIIAALGEPEECYGLAEDDAEFGPFGEVIAVWPHVMFTHRGLIPYPSAANRIEFLQPSIQASEWLASAKARRQQIDWSIDHDPSEQIEEYADPDDSANRIFRVEYDQDGEIMAFSFSSLH